MPHGRSDEIGYHEEHPKANECGSKSFCFFHNLISFLVLAFCDIPSLRTHFWPFTRVLSEILPEVTRKVWKTADDTDITNGFPRWRLTQTSYN